MKRASAPQLPEEAIIQLTACIQSAFWYDMVVKRGKKAQSYACFTKGRYTLRVIVDLAQHQAAGRTPLKKIAARQGISEKYLENILAIFG